MGKAKPKALGVIAKALQGFQATYEAKTKEARAALVSASALVWDIDNRKSAFSGDDGKALTGKALINARGAWYADQGIEPWFTNLARALSGAVALLGSAWVTKQSTETIKRLAPEISAKHKSGKSKGKLRSVADRKRLVKERLEAATNVAKERGAKAPSGDDISESRNAERGPKAGKSLAWLRDRAAEVDVSKTGTITLAEWEAVVTIVTNGSATMAKHLTAKAQGEALKAKAKSKSKAKRKSA